MTLHVTAGNCVSRKVIEGRLPGPARPPQYATFRQSILEP